MITVELPVERQATARCLVCGAAGSPVSLLRDGRLWASCDQCSRTPLAEEQLRGARDVSEVEFARLRAAIRAPTMKPPTPT